MPQPKGAATSGRYTAPKPKSTKESPAWLPAIMGTTFVVGIGVIIANYLSLFPGKEPQNRYLFLGLAWVIVGFSMASTWK